MKPAVYLPLDERPCNRKYPEMLSRMTALPLSLPPEDLYGNKKKPADCAKLASWLQQQAVEAESMIVSLDMLVYGGIVPSRLHQASVEQCLNRLEVLSKIKERNPQVKIRAFNLIMRVPAYDGDDEEPAYYAQYGRRIHRFGWIEDKRSGGGLSESENEELAEITRTVPAEVLDDFTRRRAVNAEVNRHAIRLVRDGVIDLLIIPLDDNAEYGFSAMEQRQLIAHAESLEVSDRVHIYPGADEIGCTLFARVFNETVGFQPEFFVRYSSTAAPFVIPRYEDRSLNESIKAHLTASGSFKSDSPDSAHVVLCVNAPPVGAAQAAESTTAFEDRSHAYFSETNSKELIQAIKYYTDRGRLVALADTAVSNGSDHVFMKQLSRAGLLGRLSAYAAWNTSGNSLGTVIAHAAVEAYYRYSGAERSEEQKQLSRLFYVFRLLEDWGYQSLVRSEITRYELDSLGGNYFDIAALEADVSAIAETKLLHFAGTFLQDVHADRISLDRVYFPWKRMFEIGLDVSWKSE
ncbi:hypothetical protein SD71_07230 [Cohnella kolymensis]|uniref:DUF4127 family protein n=1 Tax=Cohnella kolymensis TaxID=1590652 RepID=A0ABR5A635_9BACL|nr:DUF4127 family protein [Cohnella kolymensis]KIL36541.1 hypothetical protein SD71_07230 [Cohnella kolymensis]